MQKGDTHKDNIDGARLFIGMNSLATDDSKCESTNVFLLLGVSIRHKKTKESYLKTVQYLICRCQGHNLVQLVDEQFKLTLARVVLRSMTLANGLQMKDRLTLRKLSTSNN